jgi:hypothetical protein
MASTQRGFSSQEGRGRGPYGAGAVPGVGRAGADRGRRAEPQAQGRGAAVARAAGQEGRA